MYANALRKAATAQEDAAAYLHQQANQMEAGNSLASSEEVSRFHLLVQGAAEVALTTAEKTNRLAMQEQQLAHNAERYALEQKNRHIQQEISVALHEKRILTDAVYLYRSQIIDVRRDNAELKRNQEVDFCKMINTYRNESGRISQFSHSRLNVTNQFNLFKNHNGLTPLICGLYYEYFAELTLNKNEQDCSEAASVFFQAAMKNYLEVKGNEKNHCLISCLNGLEACQLTEEALAPLFPVCLQALQVYLNSLKPLKDNISPAELLYCLAMVNQTVDRQLAVSYVAHLTDTANAETRLDDLLTRLNGDGFVLAKDKSLYMAPSLKKLLQTMMPSSSLFAFTTAISPEVEIDAFGRAVFQASNVQIEAVFNLAKTLQKPLNTILGPRYLALWHELQGEKVFNEKPKSEWAQSNQDFTEALNLYRSCNDLSGVARSENGIARSLMQQSTPFHSHEFLHSKAYEHHVNALKYWLEAPQDLCPSVVSEYVQLIKTTFATSIQEDIIESLPDPFFHTLCVSKRFKFDLDRAQKLCSTNLQALKFLDISYDGQAETCFRIMARALKQSRFKCISAIGQQETVFYMRMTDPHAEGTDQALPNLTQLTHLKLGRSYISHLMGSNSEGLGPEGAKVLALALPNLKQLVELNLGQNYIEADGAKAIASALSNLINLTKLNLDSNLFGPEGGKAIASALPNLINLTKLNLGGGNSFCPEGAKAIAGALPNLINLTKLNLSGAHLFSEGATAIAGALPNLVNLTKLNLDNNDLFAEEAKVLALALLNLTQLSELSLAMNNLGDDGAKAIAIALPHLTQLSELDLSSNSLGNDGAKAIAKALPNLTQLSELNLSFNSLGRKGKKAITQALKNSNQLINLDLENHTWMRLLALGLIEE